MIQGFRGDPMIDQIWLRRTYLKALKIQDIDDAIVKEAPPPPPDPAMLKIQADIAAKHVEVNAKVEDMAKQHELLSAKIENMQADTALKMAQAEAVNIDPQLKVFMAQLEHMFEARLSVIQAKLQPQQPPQGEGAVNEQPQGNDEGAVSGMGGAPANTAVPPVPPGLPAGADGGMGAGQPDAAAPTDGAVPNGQ
jgi:hypothetical protein